MTVLAHFIVLVLALAGSRSWGQDTAFLLYRVELMTPGGALPFLLAREVSTHSSPTMERVSVWGVVNGDERIICDQVEHEAIGYYGQSHDALARRERRYHTRTTLRFDQYDSSLTWRTWTGFRPGGEPVRGEGVWRKRRGDGYVELPALVTELGTTGLRKDELAEAPERFLPLSPHAMEPVGATGAPGAFAGRWRVEFEGSDDAAVAIFVVGDDQLASGTFMTTTGDYRFLAGRVDGPYLRLSTFDGAHAFLFHARMQEDGTIKGDFWSGNWHHETWTAVRDDDATLPDAFAQTSVTDEHAIEGLVFKDVEGRPTRVLDALDATGAKARVIEIFGTWCPNCADASRELVSLKAKYGDDLGVVGLAFEVSDDFQRSARQVKRHHAHIGSGWQVLIAGLSDKDMATKTLGFLDKVRSYPTLVFLDEHNRVRAVYSGFSGPATGEAYKDQRLGFEALIEEIIKGE